MMRTTMKVLAAAVLCCGASMASAAPGLLSADWARDACQAWNADATLTKELHASGWVANDKKRGYKVLQVHRTDCAGSPRVELRIASKDGKALCVAGGLSSAKLDFDAD